MARYFNATKGPLSVTLLSELSLTIAPKTYGYVRGRDESSPELQKYCKKGFLVRSEEMPSAPQLTAPAISASPEEEIDRSRTSPTEVAETVADAAADAEPHAELPAEEPVLVGTGSGITELGSESTRRRRR
jgi:hypothetical protein